MELTHSRFKDISANTLKLVAISAMFIDHMATWLVPQNSPVGVLLHTVGRLAAPIMCYIVAEGCHYTRNIRRYALRMLGFAAISHLPYVWYFKLTWYKTTSVFWTLFLGIVALAACKSDALRVWQKVLVVGACCAASLVADWSYIGILWILGFGLLRESLTKQVICFCAVGGLLYILPGLMQDAAHNFFRFGILLAVPLFTLYAGRRGRKSPLLKWAFYVFYPLHLLALLGMRALLGAVW